MPYVFSCLRKVVLIQFLTVILATAPGRLAHSAETLGGKSPMAIDSTLTLAWLERAVLERNPTLAAARAAWEGTKAATRQAGALEDPKFDVMVAPRSLSSESVEAAYKVGVIQRYPLFGQRGLRRRAARAEAEASGFDLEVTRLDILRGVRIGYYEHFRIARSQETNRELIELVERFHNAALAKYAAGTVGQTDPLQAEVELAMLKHQSVVLERQRRVVVAQLNALLHAPPGSALPPPPRDLPLPEAPTTGEWLEIRQPARWPELQAAKANIAARRARLMLARRQRLPEAAFGIAYNRFWGAPELRGTVGLSFNLPINLGRIADGEREARAALEMSEHEHDAVQDRVEQEIEVASARYREFRHEYHLMRDEVVPATESALNAVRAAYEANRSDFLTLLNSARDLARARLGLHEALAMAQEAHADLLRALAADAQVTGQEDKR